MRFLTVTLALALFAVAPVDAQRAPAFDLGSFLSNSTFLPHRSEFQLGMPSGYYLVFAPSNFDRYAVEGQYVIRNTSGDVVSTSAMRGKGLTNTPNIVAVDSQGMPVAIDGPGDYTLEAEFEGQVVARVPFTASAEGGDDPFDTRTMMRIDGPWRTHGYFLHEIGRPDYTMSFNTWIRRDEPGGQERTEVSIRRNGQEVAFGAGSPDGSSQAWVPVNYPLIAHSGRDPRGQFGRSAVNPDRWTIQDVTPGTYEIVISTEGGGPIRTFTIEGASGAFVAHPRSDVDVEPRHLFLTPRRMGGQLQNVSLHLDWVGPESM